ncbi:MAG: hypothetical protein K1X28_03500 [Parachlamydiales bacterium]|nr:hypothetical protein [Parachlamydiales bacterium]
MKKAVSFLFLLSSLAADEYAFSPPNELSLRNPRDFSLYAEALCLQAKEGGLEFAITDNNGAVTSIENGTVLGFSKSHGDYEYNPGIRVGMNFFFSEDRWKFDVLWTFLKITNSKGVLAPGQAVLIPLWLIPQANSTNQTLHATWESNFNTLDFRMAKPFDVSRYFSLIPHFGGRIAFIDQHFSVSYGGFFGAKRGAVSHNDNDFAGLGMRGGVDTEWKLGKDWALIGNIAGSIIWGQFDLDQNLAQGVSLGYDIVQKTNLNIPNLEIAAGISWGHNFIRNKFRIDARLAYEFQEWWDMNHLRRFFSSGPGYVNQNVTRNALTLNGLSFRLQIDL